MSRQKTSQNAPNYAAAANPYLDKIHIVSTPYLDKI